MRDRRVVGHLAKNGKYRFVLDVESSTIVTIRHGEAVNFSYDGLPRPSIPVSTALEGHRTTVKHKADNKFTASECPANIKVLHDVALCGVSLGAFAWVMISFADVEEIRIISNLGGFPAAILILLTIASLTQVVFNYRYFDCVSNPDA